MTVTATKRSSWQELAACKSADPGIFFPVGTSGQAALSTERARAICGTCNVRDDCLMYAFETNQEAGIWGGFPEDERRRLRKRWLAERRRTR
jgi:WhiB family redox-sensing transcriptional regulator